MSCSRIIVEDRADSEVVLARLAEKLANVFVILGMMFMLLFSVGLSLASSTIVRESAASALAAIEKPEKTGGAGVYRRAGPQTKVELHISPEDLKHILQKMNETGCEEARKAAQEYLAAGKIEEGWDPEIILKSMNQKCDSAAREVAREYLLGLQKITPPSRPPSPPSNPSTSPTEPGPPTPLPPPAAPLSQSPSGTHNITTPSRPTAPPALIHAGTAPPLPPPPVPLAQPQQPMSSPSGAPAAKQPSARKDGPVSAAVDEAGRPIRIVDARGKAGRGVPFVGPKVDDSDCSQEFRLPVPFQMRCTELAVSQLEDCNKYYGYSERKIKKLRYVEYVDGDGKSNPSSEHETAFYKETWASICKAKTSILFTRGRPCVEDRKCDDGKEHKLILSHRRRDGWIDPALDQPGTA